jgi:quercetin dioxygenase-like cupin family protein
MGGKRRLRFCRVAAALFLHVAMTGIPLPAQQAGHQSSRVTISHALPALNGKKLVVSVVEVTYGPGEASTSHSHPCPVIAYVAEGEIRSQVEGQPEAVYKAGDSFYEAPNGVHAVSANASQTRSAKLVAFFVCDHPAPLSAPAERNRK